MKKVKLMNIGLRGTILATLVTGSIASAAPTVYDWSPAGNQGLLGWTHLLTDTSGTGGRPNPYQFSDISDNLRMPAGFEDLNHTTVVVESPSFTINGNTSITFELMQGTVGGPLVSNFSLLPSTSSATGFAGLALKRNSTGDYLLSKGKTVNFTPETFSWTTSELLTATSGHGSSETYSLQLIDYKEGSWGHVGARTITVVPEPSSAMLLGLFGMSLLIRRRK